MSNEIREEGADVDVAADAKTQETKSGWAAITVRAVACVVILAAGFAAKAGLASLKQPPKQVEISEPILQVEVKPVHPEDVPVVIEGWGQVSVLDTVQVTAEVMGNVVEIHPRLEVGEVIPAGELLFRIDPRDYESQVAQGDAQVKQMETNLALLRTQYGNDTERLETLKRTRDLAEEEYLRLKRLFEKDEVGSQSVVDRAEMSFNQADDGFDQLKQLVALYPMRIQEAEAGLESAKAQWTLASTRLERTAVHAPFTARIKMKQVELGQYVAPGAPVLALADDSVLEIAVGLDSQDARSWLRFADPQTGDESWFGHPEKVSCRITWTEDPGNHEWTGTLDRVLRFDEASRTVHVAIRVTGAEAASSEDGLPLVEGMFCQVEIPGKIVENVYRLPRSAVSFEGQVYLARQGLEYVHFEPGSKAQEAREVYEQAKAAEGEDAVKKDAWTQVIEMAEAMQAEAGETGRVSQWAMGEALPEALASVSDALWARGTVDAVEAPDGLYVAKTAARLERRDVVVAREQEEDAFISEGLETGDLVVVTRLVNPLPNSLLGYARPEAEN